MKEAKRVTRMVAGGLGAAAIAFALAPGVGRADPSGVPAPAVVAGPSCMNVDGTGQVEVETDLTYIARYILGLPPVPDSFRDEDPGIPSDASITAAITGMCTGSPGGGSFPASGQTTAYGAGSDGAVQAGATLSYTDNGDGTITDNNTGLMWEKKSNDGSIHDKDNTYTWGMTSSPYTMNGTMVTSFLATLNTAPCFAGHCDWRIPNVKELQSIVDYEVPYPGPTVSPAFNTNCTSGCTVTTCSCTAADGYWSSTTYRNLPDYAWDVYFYNGSVSHDGKSNLSDVRAVRGAL